MCGRVDYGAKKKEKEPKQSSYLEGRKESEVTWSKHKFFVTLWFLTFRAESSMLDNVRSAYLETKQTC